MQTEGSVYRKLQKIEHEISTVKKMVKEEGELVSLRGIATIKVSDQELNKAIYDAKSSISKGAQDVLR